MIPKITLLLNALFLKYEMCKMTLRKRYFSMKKFYLKKHFTFGQKMFLYYSLAHMCFSLLNIYYIFKKLFEMF